MENRNRTKTRKPRRHPVLGRPCPGAVLLMLWGFFFSNFAASLPAFLITGSGSGAAVYYSSAVGGILVLLIHRLWFRGEYRGSFRRGTSLRKPILIAAGVYLAVDLVIWCADCFRMGICPLSFTMLGAALMAGFSEEAAFRALPVSIMMRRLKDRSSCLPALIFPAVCFGLIHLMNAGESPLSTTLLQVVTAMATGFLLGAIYLRTGSMLLPIVLHTFHDIISFMIVSQSTGYAVFTLTAVDVCENVAEAVIELALAIWLIRGHQEEIRAVWQERWQLPQAGTDAEG